MRDEHLNPWIVFDRRDGREICQAAAWRDAVMMISFDPDHRDVRRRRLVLDQVVDVTSQVLDPDPRLPEQLVLPDRQQEPFVP
jgi:hypothetical protein